MRDYRQAVNEHYGGVDISARVRERLRDAGIDPETVSRDQLASFDELHGGGRESTRALARLAGLKEGMTVLDVGSGVGGPARTLAAEFGCLVTGLDITEEFCRAAEMLTAFTGLSEHIRFRIGDARNLPFEDESFDVVWSQNTLMNIEDKARVFREAFRVLRPGGLLAFEAILAGDTPGVHLPAFWASSADLSFLSRPEELRRWVQEAGFVEEAWNDVTPRNMGSSRARPLAGLGRDVIVPMDAATKRDNSLRNFEEGRVCAVEALFRRPAA